MTMNCEYKKRGKSAGWSFEGIQGSRSGNHLVGVAWLTKYGVPFAACPPLQVGGGSVVFSPISGTRCFLRTTRDTDNNKSSHVCTAQTKFDSKLSPRLRQPKIEVN